MLKPYAQSTYILRTPRTYPDLEARYCPVYHTTTSLLTAGVQVVCDSSTYIASPGSFSTIALLTCIVPVQDPWLTTRYSAHRAVTWPLRTSVLLRDEINAILSLFARRLRVLAFEQLQTDPDTCCAGRRPSISVYHTLSLPSLDFVEPLSDRLFRYRSWPTIKRYSPRDSTSQVESNR